MVLYAINTKNNMLCASLLKFIDYNDDITPWYTVCYIILRF